jgi:hypothetical protein
MLSAYGYILHESGPYPLMDQAWAIAQQFGLTTAEVGLIDEKSMPILMLNAA